MGNFKVGDVVERVSGCDLSDGLPAGEVGIVSVLHGNDFVEIGGYGDWEHYVKNLELVERGDDPLPPAPESVLYNARSDQWCSLEVSSLKANEYYDARIRIGVRNNCGEHGKVTCLTPEAALQLAHDLRRMAMEIRRKERNG